MLADLRGNYIDLAEAFIPANTQLEQIDPVKVALVGDAWHLSHEKGGPNLFAFDLYNASDHGSYLAG